MNTYITPNDFANVASSDSQAISLAISEAQTKGINEIIIPKYNARTQTNVWEISEAILLPSHITVILDNCILRQSDGCIDNVFRTQYTHTDPYKKHEQIHIIGRGSALIDGANHNGLTESTSNKNGMPHIIYNNMILLTNIENFSICGITMRDMRWWAVNLIFASYGRIDNITFDARDNIPNQDGIDLRVGCHDITISNIFGLAGDDLIALSGFAGFEKRMGFWTEEKSPDIRNISIRNVVGASVTKAIIALRNHDGIKLHDILIDGVFDTSEDNKSTPYATVRIGQKTYSNIRFSTLSETSRITARNIHTYSGDAIMVNVSLENSVFENIFLSKTARSALTTRSDWQAPGAVMRSVVVRGVFYDPGNTASAPIFDFVKEKDEEYFENVKLSDIFTTDNRKILSSDYKNGIVTDF